MGPRVMRRLPKYVHGFVDRHGKPRFYFRGPASKPSHSPACRTAPEFMAAYELAAAGQPLPGRGGPVAPWHDGGPGI